MCTKEILNCCGWVLYLWFL